MREKFESEQQAGILKNERLSLILATYQRNLEITEQKLVASQQENIDLHIQIKQLIQNSSKLQHQIKDLSAAASASNLLAAPEVQAEKTGQANQAASTVAAAAASAEMLEQQKQYSAIFSALTEQIKELKDQMRSNNAAANTKQLADSVSATASKAALSTNVSGKGAALVDTPAAEPASSDVIAEAIAAALSRQASSSKLGHLSHEPTPPATPPPRKSSSAVSGIGMPAGTPPETTPNRASKASLPSAPAASASAKGPPVVPAEDISILDNPHGFKSMAECLAHIAALESNSHQALTNQLQKVQQRASELTIRNAALEEELSSYQAYMRDVVPQYKKQLQYMKQQLKVKTAGVAMAAQLPPGAASNDEFRLPLIK